MAVVWAAAGMKVKKSIYRMSAVRLEVVPSGRTRHSWRTVEFSTQSAETSCGLGRQRSVFWCGVKVPRRDPNVVDKLTGWCHKIRTTKSWLEWNSQWLRGAAVVVVDVGQRNHDLSQNISLAFLRHQKHQRLVHTVHLATNKTDLHNP